jgi:hypothetical protein
MPDCALTLRYPAIILPTPSLAFGWLRMKKRRHESR